MMKMNLGKCLIALAVVLTCGLNLSTSYAECCLLNDDCNECCCPKCCYQCKFKAEKGEEERSCWKVEQDVICVPRVTFPWQKTACNPCANNGAFLVKVKTLKSHKYTCPICEYSWSAEKVPCRVKPVCEPVCKPVCEPVCEPLASMPEPIVDGAIVDGAVVEGAVVTATAYDDSDFMDSSGSGLATVHVAPWPGEGLAAPILPSSRE